MSPRLALGLALVCLGVIACGAREDAPVLEARERVATVDVGLVLGDDRLSAVWLGASPPHVDDAPEVARGATVRWELRDGERVLARGTAPDPRLRLGEVLVRGSLAPIATRVSSGALTLTVPNAGGTLAILDADRELATTLPKLPASERFTSDADAAAAPVKIFDGGPCALLSIVVMPEGFTAAELPSFHAKADALVRGLASVPGFGGSRFEAYRADLASAQSGLSDAGDRRDTAWNVHYGVPPEPRRAIAWSEPNEAALAAYGRAVTAAKLTKTALVVLVNSSEDLGSSDRGMRSVVLSASKDAPRALAHELGHVLGHLADEYDYGVCDLATAGAAPNTTKDRGAPPWSAILSSEPVEGAEACARGVFRPQATCLMRDLDHDLCPVCRAKLDAFFARRLAGLPASCQPPKPDCTGPICLVDEDCNPDGGGAQICVPSSAPDAGALFACVPREAGCRN